MDSQERSGGRAAAATATLAHYAKAGVAQAALVSLDADGRVKAMIGGADYSASSFNRAIDAHRQAGSSWKPFVYLTALYTGLTPDTPEVDQPVTIDGWSPHDFEPGFLGPVTLQQALAQSINTVAASVADEVPEPAQRLPLHRPAPRCHHPDQSRSGHGAGHVAGDPHRDGRCLRRVFQRRQPRRPLRPGADPHQCFLRQDPSGSTAARPVTAPAIANPPLLFELNQMLRTVITSGTGTKAAIPGYDLAGKTGTTSDYKDAWFDGFTGGLTTVVWMGRDDDTPMKGITGGSAPAEFWRTYMRAELKAVASPGDLPGPATRPRRRCRTVPGLPTNRHLLLLPQ